MKELIHRYGAGIVLALVFLESIGLPLLGEAILMELAGTMQELGIALSAVLGAILAAPSATASAIGTDIRSCFATDPTSTERNKNQDRPLIRFGVMEWSLCSLIALWLC